MISLCYIVKDEMLNLPYSIFNMRGKVDEICIVDTGSTDGTKAYAKSVADKYADFKWNDNFSDARNNSLKLATHDWILVLDADEFIANDVKFLSHKFPDVDGFEFKIHSFMQDPRWVEQPNSIFGNSVRLFKKKFRYKGLVHNKLIINNVYDASKIISVYNYQFMERYRIDWKCEQNKRLMDKKIALEGLSHINCIHYGDIYRKLWTWQGGEDNAYAAIDWFNKSLKYEESPILRQIIKRIENEVQYVREHKNVG